jgi:hypothetical protein
LCISFKSANVYNPRMKIQAWLHFIYFYYSCFFFIHLFICAYIVWAISLPYPLPPPSPLHPPHLQAEPVLPSSPILLNSRHKQYKERHSIFASWVKDSYTERFLAFLPCTCVLQPKLIHLYQTSSLLPSHLPIVTSVILRLLY